MSVSKFILVLGRKSLCTNPGQMGQTCSNKPESKKERLVMGKLDKRNSTIH